MTSISGPALAPSARILVIRLRRFGDVLLLTPTLRAIRQAYPAARLDVLTLAGFDQVLINNPHIDRVLVLEHGMVSWLRAIATCRAARYDAVLDLQSSPRSALLVLTSGVRVRVGWEKLRPRDRIYNRLVPGWNDPIYVARKFPRVAAVIGVPAPADVRLALAVSEADRERAAALFTQAGIRSDRPIVAISAAAKVRDKQWLPKRYAAVADCLVRAHGAQLVLTAAADEVEQVRAVVARMQERPALWDYGATTIQELAAMYERCHVWIGNDGGAKHIATAAGCPTVVIIRTGAERLWTDSANDPDQIVVSAPTGLEQSDPVATATVEQVCDAAAPFLHRRAGRDDG
ncbi:MAG: glycosyltransferase family 9 protein [Deltaproteobacteria bacterium]|nr:glycosyltransferase family 9 protein [Deltaproteobacteria bacterium]MBI3387008.1 glycosyltransferase family 9 protein [Deltaproteobacteria bacterium]